MRNMWKRSRWNQRTIVLAVVLCIIYYPLYMEQNQGQTRRTVRPKPALTPVVEIKQPSDLNNRYIEKKLEQALEQDRGTGCEIPRLDPFAKEVTKFDKTHPKIVCPGRDWVKCYHSECKVVPEILKTMKGVVCIYRDILYVSDSVRHLGKSVRVLGEQTYVLRWSDHVKVTCSGKRRGSIWKREWKGHAIGFRQLTPNPPPPGRKDSFNVLILGFDSTAKNTFIRRMPNSYKVLTELLEATVLNGYNILGDGTPAALFPILTGKTELELPDVRKTMNNSTMDSMPFIFYKLREDGYRTAYFEDMPWIGTFQLRFNGFKHQPADHYLRAFYMEEFGEGNKWWSSSYKYCVGDTPQYKLMLNITDQFLQLDGRKYAFTFIGDIAHDDINMIATTDNDTADFLRNFSRSTMVQDTLLIVMGDHGPRYANVRGTLQGKLEERLPLMAIRLPDILKNSRPDAQRNLEQNSGVLTTPHDIYATVLDVLDLRKYWSDYRVRGADLTRGLTLLDEVPKNRSCSEAAIEPHWCSCLSWKALAEDDPMYGRVAAAFVDYINSLTEPVRSKCVPRTLLSVSAVMRHRPNAGVLSFVAAKDYDGYVGKFGPGISPSVDNYQIKVSVGPGNGKYEASLRYLAKENRLELTTRDISRTNAYNNEPSCISATHPHLNMYCFCKSG